MIRSQSWLVPLAFMLGLSTLACAEGSREGDQATDTTAPGATQSTASEGSVTSQTFLDPNAASREELLALPGMDSSAAEALIRGRPHGDMVAVDRALANQLTEKERDSLYTRLWNPIDLNTASGDEILLIPGVGPRMRHEFEEYRPYNSIERFRREIGKYVDSAEVARLERYVTLRTNEE
jgi:DNA uptake protein ComE-like DNA-binding protein